jgi:glycosyltransferase involved in cell wall biosynthesis
MQIVIFDPVTPAPYSLSRAQAKPLGGTEATVVRIAEAMDAIVVQHNRIDNEGRYRNPAACPEPTHLVVLREAQAALEIAKRYPDARKILWLHDLAATSMDRGKKLLKYAPQLAAQGFTLVCVSDFHAQQVRENFLSLPSEQRPRVTRVYNPVDVSAASEQTLPFDPNKLVFFSSPHKGLEYATIIFSQLRSKNPDLRLYIANPGYLADAAKAQPGVINLGIVPHHIILEHVKSALCTFYPNYVYPETFGLALAESNALGTPVLTHGIGAAVEVLNGDRQIIDVPKARDLADSVFWHWPALRRSGEALLGMLGGANAYGERIREWQQGGRPAVCGRPEFAIDNVVAAWNEVHNLKADQLNLLSERA